MRWFFAFAAVFALAMYLGAQLTLEHPVNDGLVHMRWATDANPARKNQLSKFSEMFPEARITVDPGLGADQTKLIVQCATGTGPDLIDVYDSVQMRSLVDAGVLLDVTPYAAEMGFGPEKTFPSLRANLEVDGKQYRFPCNIATFNILYNKRVFDELGVPYPSKDLTFPELIEIGRRIRSKSKSKGRTIIPLPGYDVRELMVQMGAQSFSENGLFAEYDSPQSIAAMQMRYDLMHKHRVIPTAGESASLTGQGGWGANDVTWFSTGKAAMLYIGRWYSVQLPEYPDIKDHIGIAPVPRLVGFHSMSRIETRAAAVNAKSPHWREALKFLTYLASPEYTKIIIQDGDGIPPNPEVATSGEAMVNSLLPDPAIQQSFLEATKNARSLRLSAFVENGQVTRWIDEAQGFVDNKIKTPEKAMRDLAAEVNRTIRLNLERRPDLQRRFEATTGMRYSADWFTKLDHEPAKPVGRL